MDFEGTTSVSQFRADSVEDALRQWLNDLSRQDSYGLTKQQRARLVAGFNNFDIDWAPALLDGLQNV